jgi:hypothetical protein
MQYQVPKSNLNCAKFVVWTVCQVAKGEPAQMPICTLNIVLPENIILDAGPSEPDLLELEKNYSFLRDGISEYQCLHCPVAQNLVFCSVLRTQYGQIFHPGT